VRGIRRADTVSVTYDALNLTRTKRLSGTSSLILTPAPCHSFRPMLTEG